MSKQTENLERLLSRIRAVALLTPFVLVICVFLLKGTHVEASGSQWFTDIDKALVESGKIHKPVLVDFSGSDWCGWCIKLDNEVFKKEHFLAWAKDSVVLCVLDFPRDKTKVSEKQRRKNQIVAKKYMVRGYPTVLLLDKNGKVLAKTGYQAGGPVEYTNMLDRLLKK